MTIRACLGIACLTLAATAQSQEQQPASSLPLWEAGLFGGAASTPAYPGAEDRSTRALVLPMLIYRGKILRADRSGIGARLINTERVELDIGFALSLPARSNDVAARAGMPDLNSLLEFGPRLKVQLAERMRLELPLRVPVELRNGFARQGLVFEPRLVFETSDRSGKWHADANIGAVYGNQKLNQYFYEVAPQYVTATRPRYEAGGGLMMTRLGASLSRQLSPDWRIFGFARYDNLSHAANRESPLFRKNSGLSAGIGFTWTAHRSTARAWD
ncbi:MULTISPECIES: MipA/OmpV family protein [unclassified Duganella]|uniref:MipA/OmpV family protein n=1 Tax=unclassified Duganella TaxID=2636909 RepID=UPI0008829344|nr:MULTISPECIES: MipA/OmpV family protein [unclassified Duganella]SDH38371.1 Outer membrane scaffolding protein for murein synthesis, MipA/OmpV family [Duganella sp. OV458]SDK73981.1 Outer membrane scaffolding protein for murein synthesis, MipA/OmpV family [Duganella sp. OV510]